MNLFKKIEELNNLEKKHKYDEIIKFLKSEWLDNKNDVDVILRVVSECWYILTEEDITICKKQCDFDACKETLICVTNYCIENGYIYNETCSWFFGYAISLFPFFFYSGNSEKKYTYFDCLGKKICTGLINDNSTQKIIKYLCYGFFIKNNEIKICEADIQEAFEGNSLIENYFKEICLTGLKS